MAVRPGGKLRHRPKSWIGGLRIRERRETSFTHRLITVHLRQVRLIYGSRPYVLRVNAASASELMLQSEAPLHKIWRVKFSIGHRRECHGRKARRWICQR